MRWLEIFVRTMLGLVFGVFAVPWAVDLLVATVRQLKTLPPQPIALGVGLAGGIAWWFWRRPNALLNTVIHELCHTLLCVILFVEVTKIEASKHQGGSVEHTQVDPVRATFIAIAPYTVPLLLGPALLARMALNTGAWAEVLSAFVCCLFCTHLQGLVINIRQNFWKADADIPRVGHVLALGMIITALLLITAGTLRVLWR